MKIRGRQRLSAGDIEERAAMLLHLFKPDFFEYVQHTPLLRIAEFLTQKHKITFDFNSILGFSDNGERILGATNLKKRIILIDASLQQDEHKFNFTLAHELGHLSLHRNLTFEHTDDPAGEPIETVKEVFNYKGNLNTEVEWVEWQANAYAIALLMPGPIVNGAVITQQKEMGIGRRGKIFVDAQPCNVADYFEILMRLSNFFKVSKAAVENRLRKFDLVEDHRAGVQSISEILSMKGLI